MPLVPSLGPCCSPTMDHVESLCASHGSRGELAACVVIKKSSRPMPSSRHVGHRWGAVRGALCRVSARKQAQSGRQPAPRFRALSENVPCGHCG